MALNTRSIREFLPKGYQKLPRMDEGDFNRQVLLAKQGDINARNACTEAYLWLVAVRAKRFAGHSGQLSVSDLVQEGSIGLFDAIRKFEPEKGFRFGTYARYWIDNSIFRALSDMGREIRLPVHVVTDLRKMAKHREDLTKILNVEPTNDEFVEYLLAQGMGPHDRITERMRHGTLQPVMMSAMPGEDDYSPLEEISDPNTKPEEELLSSLDRTRGMVALVAPLPERERYVLLARFKHEKTLNEVGEDLQLSGERIRQIEVGALQRLRRLRGRWKKDHDLPD